MILQNALVYTPRHTFERGTIVIRDGRIVPFAAPEEGEEVLDAVAGPRPDGGGASRGPYPPPLLP